MRSATLWQSARTGVPSNAVRRLVVLNGADRIHLLVALVGAGLYAAIAGGLLWSPDGPYFGSGLYDAYWTAVTEGRLDVPPRLASFEGHYAADGRAYLYHGAGPLAFRAALGWLVDLDRVSLAPMSVFVSAAVGTTFYHLAFRMVWRRAAPMGWATPGAALGAAALWFGGPGVLLAANTSLYHEPIALAYALGGVTVFVLVRIAHGALRLRAAIIPLAALAAACVHARPNLALGLYAGAGLLMLACLLRERWRAVAPIGVAACLLVASGVGFVSLNAAKFGEPLATHGHFEATEGPIYGTVFWGVEAPDSARAQAFAEHGRFNLKRVVPNASLYLLALPQPPAASGRPETGMVGLFHRVTEPFLGFIRVEPPSVGAVLLWPLVCLVALFGFVGDRRALRQRAFLGAGLAAAALVTLSYGTVTLRYRVDLWPLIAFLALVGLPAFAQAIRRAARRSARPALLVAALGGLTVVGFSTNAGAARFTSGYLGGWASASQADCVAAYERNGFAEPVIARACGAPPTRHSVPVLKKASL